MPTPNHELPNPATWRSRLRTAAFFVGVGLLPIAAPAALVAAKDPKIFADVAHALFGEQSPTEQKISGALRAALGIDVPIRCAPTPTETGKKVTVGRSFSLFGFNTIGLQKDEVCDRLSGDINATLTEPFGVDDDRRARAVGAILTVAHEGAHIKYSADSESTTECQGYQDAPAVAKALGVTDANMKEVLYMLPLVHNKSLDEYLTTADCADGGAEDLHPDQVGGIFPLPGRQG
jgi:hypothetical protein